MKRKFLYLAMLVGMLSAVTIMTSCGKDEETSFVTITGDVE